MFSSVSGCVPNSRIRLSFVSLINQDLGISATDVIVYVGIAQVITRPVPLAVGDIVEIELDTPPGYLGYKFYEYTLNDIQHSFAVVNQNDYRPTLKPNDAPRKWFNYFPREIRTSFYDANSDITRPLGRGINFVNIDATHVVLDHTKEQVNFYSPNRELVTSVYLPSGPVEYKKSGYVDSNNISRVELFVICNDKKLYRIRFDNQFSESSEFFPTITFIRSLELIWYEADLPTGESYIDNRRNSLRSKINPPMTALDVFGGLIWVAGYDTVYVLNKNFQTLATVRIGTESIVSISCLTETTAYAITREGKIYQVTAAGSFTMFYNAARPLGVPARVDTFGPTPVIVVPDPHHQRLLKIVGPVPPVLANSVATPGYAPAYARVFDDNLLITSYDNNKVLKYTSWSDQTVYDFSEKVTIASWVNHTLLAVHYLKDYVTLDLAGIEKVIPINIRPVKGPVTHIGTEPVKLIMLGQESIILHGGPGVTCWVNGIKDEPANTGDNFSISYKAGGSGLHRVSYILGDQAYDIDIEAVGDGEYLNSYKAGAVGINRLSTLSNVTSLLLPTTGNAQTGTTLLNLGLTWNFFGNAYTQVNVSTNGFISFGSSIPTGLFTTVGGLNIDALYVELTDLYQGLALNNTDPNNITFFPLTTGELPAVSYESGSNLGVGYARIRWAGIKGNPDPAGNTITARTSLSSSVDIPSAVPEFSKASTGDYVSGAGIVLPTRVVGNYLTPIFEFLIYKFLSGSRVAVTSYNSNVLSVARYSAVDGAVSYVTSKSRTLSVAPTRPVTTQTNHLLAIFDKTAIIDGKIDSRVTNDWSIRIPTFGAQPNFVYQTGIASITETTDTITCLGIYTEFDGNGNISLVDPQRMFVSSSDFDLLYVNQYLIGIPTGATFVTNKQIIGNSYVIGSSIVHLLSSGDTFTIETTTVTTVSNMPTLANDGVELNKPVSFEFSTLTLSTIFGLALTNITVQGAFITVDTPVSVASGTTITFKSGTPPDEFMYEVGFYQNNKYQFIEYFYDNTSHSATSNIGMSTAARPLGKKILLNTAPAGSSIVYYSEIGTGIFKPLGLGSFDFYLSLGIVAPKIAKGVIKSDYDYTVEFYVDQDLTPQSNVYLAASYGQLHLNGSKYTIDKPIKKNDLIQLTTPFNRALRAIAPILSLGTSQFPIPMMASAAINTLTRHNFLFDNLITNVLVSVTLTVPASDNYYVPDLYRYGLSLFPEFEYIVTRAGNNITLQSGNTYDLFVGDQLTITGILTSAVAADTRDIVLIGQNNAIIATAKTSGPQLVDQLTFDTLIHPYTDNYYYIFSNVAAPYVEELTGYETANIVLTAASGITTANLYIGDVQTDFVINGTRLGNYVANVPIGSNISIRRSFIDYFQSNVVIYQVEFDSAADSNIYLPVGQWNVDNKIISGGDLLQNNISTAKLDAQFASTFNSFDFALTPNNTLPTMFELGEILPLASRPTTFASDRILEEFVRVGTYNLFAISSRVAGSDLSVLLIDRIYQNFLEPNYIKISSITHQYVDAGAYNLIDSIREDSIDSATFSTGKIQDSVSSNHTELYISEINGIVGYGSTFSLTSIDSDLLANYSILTVETAARLIELFSYIDTKFIFILEEIVSFVESSLEEDIENLYTFNLIDPPEAMSGIVGNYGVLASQIASWEESFNYLSTATQADLEKLIQIFSSKLEFLILDRHSEFSSINNSLHEQIATSFKSRHELSTFAKIQEITNRIRSLREKLVSEFRSNVQSLHEADYTFFNFSNTLLMDLSKTELVFTIGSGELKQSWTDVPQFEFDKIFPQVEHFNPIDAEKDYINLIISSADRAELPERSTESLIPVTTTTAMFTELMAVMLPLVKAFTVLNIPFIPLRDLPPVYFIPFDPLLNQPLQILIPLTVMLDIVPDQLIPFDPVLFQDIIWTMEDSIPSVGAVSTYIHYWADQGQFNDKWNLRDFNANNYTRAYTPLVLYTKEYIYQPGGFYNDNDAEDEKVKYYNAGILQIPGTDFWNYRIYFKDRHFCVPRKGRIFPVTWYIRGG